MITAEQKFKIGDRVKVVNYGHKLWTWEKPRFTVLKEFRDGSFEMDMLPDLVGKEGVVFEFDGVMQYQLTGIPEKSAWYNEDQLEKL